MKLLAVDTSTDVCSAALWVDGDVIERMEPEKRHGERLLAMVELLLAESSCALTQLDAIGFSRGPGSFTSLRIGVGVVQGLAFGAGLPVACISSLAALAQAVGAAGVLAALDARMRQVYWGAYRKDGEGFMRLIGAEQVVGPAEVPIPAEPGWIGAGSGWAAYAASLQERLTTVVDDVRPDCRPQARYVAQLAADAIRRGHAVSAEQAFPVYIRDDVAVKSATAK